MKTFEELKQELLSRAKNAGACTEGYRMGLESETKSDLLKAITANWIWVLRTAKIVDTAFLEENFTEEELTEAGIYTKGEHEVKTASFAFGNATVTAYGSATVVAYDSARVVACDSARVTAYDNATVTAYGSATVKAYDSATVKAFGNATVKAYGNSYIEDHTGSIRPQSDYAIVKDYYYNKIYVKKGMFEIVEVD